MPDKEGDFLEILLGRRSTDLRLTEFPSDEQLDPLLERIVNEHCAWGGKRSEGRDWYGRFLEHAKQARDSQERSEKLIHCGAVFRAIQEYQLDMAMYQFSRPTATSLIGIGEIAAGQIMNVLLTSSDMEERITNAMSSGQEVFENIDTKLNNLAFAHDFIHRLLLHGYRFYKGCQLIDLCANIRNVVKFYASFLVGHDDANFYEKGIQIHLNLLRLLRSLLVLSSEEVEGLQDQIKRLMQELSDIYDSLEVAFQNAPQQLGRGIDARRLEILREVRRIEFESMSSENFPYHYDGTPDWNLKSLIEKQNSLVYLPGGQN